MIEYFNLIERKLAKKLFDEGQKVYAIEDDKDAWLIEEWEDDYYCKYGTVVSGYEGLVLFKTTESELEKYKGCNALLGLKIIEKYMPNKGIEGAEHDVIYSVELDEIIEAGITDEDLKELALLNWHEEDGGLACFV